MRKIPIIMWPVAGIFFLLVVAAFFLFKVPHLIMVSSTPSKLTPGESQKVSGIKFSQDYKNGEGIWRLKAKEGHMFDESQIVALKDVFLELDSVKSDSFTIKGNEGDYFRESGKVVLKGDVIGRSTNGYQIETSVLIYRQNDESVQTDEPISVVGPFFRVRGDGLYVDLKGKRFVVKKNVCTTIMGEVLGR